MRMLNLFSIALMLMVLLSCANLVPKVTIPLKDLKKLEVVHIQYVCHHKGDKIKNSVICNGSIINGDMKCEHFQSSYVCDKKEIVDFYGFTPDGFIDLTSYIKYLHQSYIEK